MSRDGMVISPHVDQDRIERYFLKYRYRMIKITNLPYLVCHVLYNSIMFQLSNACLVLQVTELFVAYAVIKQSEIVFNYG